jgi:hypothetical protein
VKHSSPGAKNLSAVLKRFAKSPAPEFPDAADPVAVLIQSFFLWEATAAEARTAYAAMKDRFVDYNELRVSLPHEIARTLDLRDRRALDRCHRLRAVLTDIFKREHAVTLERLSQLGKRELRKYLDELEGMVPFVAARLALLCFDSHSIPVDERLRARLIEEGIAEPGMDLNELSGWLSRHVKASQGPRVHYALQAWCDCPAVEPSGRDGSPRSRPASRKRAAAARTAGVRPKRA